MSKKRMLADVLWEAANEHLPTHQFSCHATARAVFGNDWRSSQWEDGSAHMFLRALGCPRYAFDCDDWGWLYEMEDDPQQRIEVRYMWLLLAMHVAEDEEIAL